MTHPHAEILRAIIDGKEVQWRINNAHSKWITLDEDHDNAIAHVFKRYSNDLQFRIKSNTVTINGVELEDDRVTSEEGLDKMYLETPWNEDFFEADYFNGASSDILSIQRGIAHHTREGAIAFCKARLGIKD